MFSETSTTFKVLAVLQMDFNRETIDFWMLRDDKVQAENASLPMVSAQLGITTEVSHGHHSNAHSSIKMMVFGILYSLSILWLYDIASHFSVKNSPSATLKC